MRITIRAAIALAAALFAGCRAPEPEPAPPACAPATAHGECGHERYRLPRRVWILRSERIVQSTFCPQHDAGVVDEFDLHHVYWGPGGTPTRTEDCAECSRLLALPVLAIGSAPRRSEGG